MKTKPEKTCPFCGGSQINVDYIFNCRNQTKAYIDCERCEITVFAYGNTPEEALNQAIEKWDMRAES